MKISSFNGNLEITY